MVMVSVIRLWSMILGGWNTETEPESLSSEMRQRKFENYEISDWLELPQCKKFFCIRYIDITNHGYSGKEKVEVLR